MTIEERFEKIEKKNTDLEKQNGRLRRLSLASIALALAALIGGTALSVRAYTAAIEPTSITTQAIYLKNASTNKVRVALTAADGSVSAYDAYGKLRVNLSSATGAVRVYGGSGQLRAQLSSEGYFNSYGANGQVRAGLSTFSGLYLFDPNGKKRVNASTTGLQVHDSNGVVRIILNPADNKITFYNASGQIVKTLP